MRRLAAFALAGGVTRGVYEGLRRFGPGRGAGAGSSGAGAESSGGFPGGAAGVPGGFPGGVPGAGVGSLGGSPDVSVSSPSGSPDAPAGSPDGSPDTSTGLPGTSTGLPAPPGALWVRRNFAGREVDLYAGPAVALGAAVASGSAPVAFAVLVAGACGAYDDVKGDHRRGFRAHLAALWDGEVTSGAVKLLGIGAASLVAGALLKERPVDKVLAGVVVAGTAHLVNLVDVRPGRAGLAVLALGVPGLPLGPLAAAPMGAAAAVLGDDLGERTMLGDTGAHALGAAVGGAIAAGNGRFGLAAHAAGLVAAAVWGERTTSSRAHPRG